MIKKELDFTIKEVLQVIQKNILGLERKMKLDSVKDIEANPNYLMFLKLGVHIASYDRLEEKLGKKEAQECRAFFKERSRILKNFRTDRKFRKFKESNRSDRRFDRRFNRFKRTSRKIGLLLEILIKVLKKSCLLSWLFKQIGRVFKKLKDYLLEIEMNAIFDSIKREKIYWIEYYPVVPVLRNGLKHVNRFFDVNRKRDSKIRYIEEKYTGIFNDGIFEYSLASFLLSLDVLISFNQLGPPLVYNLIDYSVRLIDSDDLFNSFLKSK